MVRASCLIAIINLKAYADVSSTVGPPRVTKRGIHAVRIQMDELFVDAGNQREEYHSDVGHVSGMQSIPAIRPFYNL